MGESWLDRQLAEEPAEVSEPTEADLAEELEPKKEEAPTVVKAEKEEAPEVQEERKTSKDHQVPLHELLKERDKVRNVEQQNRQLYNMLEDMKNQIQQLRTPPKQEEVPDENLDPEGFLKYQNKKLNEKIDDIDQRDQARQQQAHVAQQRQQVEGYLHKFEQEFEKQTPDFRDALIHIRTQQVQNVMSQGYTQEQAFKAVFDAEFREAVNLMALGYNPAEIIYAKAQKLGYKKTEAAPEPKAEAQEDKVKNLDKALAAAKGTGAGKGGGIDMKAILEADDNQFESIWKGMFGNMRKY